MPRAEVTLRDFNPGDAEAVHMWFNDERVTADLVGSRDSFTLDDAAAWVERAMDVSTDRKWAITIDGDDTATGPSRSTTPTASTRRFPQRTRPRRRS
jgi:hypothetical protein